MKTVVNFMGEKNFVVNPLLTLHMIAASSIFKEKSYYRPASNVDAIQFLNEDGTKIDSNEDIFSAAIQNALDYDFKGTLEYLVSLRNVYNMRKNPNIIFVEAAINANRAKFNDENPGVMREIGNKIINIPSDMTFQLDHYVSLKGSKKGMPVIMKRIWTDKLSNLSSYHVNKYKTELIDLVRIADSKKIREANEALNTLLSTGSISVDENEKTWEQLSSSGKKWSEILEQIKMPHMALLRNLRNIFSEDIPSQKATEILEVLVNGVKNGKQFPFRYYSAYNEISNTDVNFKKEVLSALEKCIDAAMNNFPTLTGRTVCLSDNSGSAWGACTSEYGSVTVATISNLSSLMTAVNSDEGKVVLFGDRILEFDVKKEKILSQVNKINKKADSVGGGTEHGLWLYLSKAIKNKEHIDNLFIYSDQQAGHGRLYGIQVDKEDLWSKNGSHYDIVKMVKRYRKEVNPKVNVYSIQVAGYDNNVLPENLYRTTLLAGWTGQECVYAKEINSLWDEIDLANR